MMWRSPGCLSLPDIFTYDENTRLLMSKQDLCDSDRLWITSLIHYSSGNNFRVGASKAAFMRSHLMGEMTAWAPCYKINLESHSFTFGHISKCCPEGDSPSNWMSLAAARCSHPQIALAVPWGRYWVLTQCWRRYLWTHHQSFDSLGDRRNSKTYFCGSFKSSVASSRAAFWEEFEVGWEILFLK